MPVFFDSSHKHDRNAEYHSANDQHPYSVKFISDYAENDTDHCENEDEAGTSQDLVIKTKSVVIPFAILCAIEAQTQAPGEDQKTLNCNYND